MVPAPPIPDARNLRALRYSEGVDFRSIADNTIVVGVPIDHESTRTIVEYIEEQKDIKGWSDLMGIFDSYNFNARKFEPLRYCSQCKMFEDGSHRFEFARRSKWPTISVFVTDQCRSKSWYHPQRFENMFSRCEFVELFVDEINRHNYLSTTKDSIWVRACAEKKWPHIRKHVNFENKSILDFGTQSGYSCVEAWSLGASYCYGIDNRQEILEVAQNVRNVLVPGRFCNSYYISFMDCFSTNETYNIDIILCMGVLHYFSYYNQIKTLKMLARSCEETFILETRYIDDGRPNPYLVVGSQSLQSISSLKIVLNECGFSIKHTYPVEHAQSYDRALFICERH